MISEEGRGIPTRRDFGGDDPQPMMPGKMSRSPVVLSPRVVGYRLLA